VTVTRAPNQQPSPIVTGALRSSPRRRCASPISCVPVSSIVSIPIEQSRPIRTGPALSTKHRYCR